MKTRAGTEEPLTWLKNYVNELNKKIKTDSLPIVLKKMPNKRIEKDKQLK